MQKILRWRTKRARPSLGRCGSTPTCEPRAGHANFRPVASGRCLGGPVLYAAEVSATGAQRHLNLGLLPRGTLGLATLADAPTRTRSDGRPGQLGMGQNPWPQ